MEKENVTNIFLGNAPSDNEILKGTTPQESYIILQNDILHTQNKELSNNIKELETKYQELEASCESTEKSLSYSKGLLKNLLIMKNLCSEQCDLYSNIEHTRHKNENRRLKNQLWVMVAICLGHACIMTVAVWLWGFGLESGLFLTHIGLSVFGLRATFISYQDNEGIKCALDGIKNRRKELDELSKSNDFLNDYIDCI